MHGRQHLEHDEGHHEHREEADEASDVTVTEFEHTQTPKVPLRVGHVHPNQPRIAEYIEEMDERNDKE